MNQTANFTTNFILWSTGLCGIIPLFVKILAVRRRKQLFSIHLPPRYNITLKIAPKELVIGSLHIHTWDWGTFARAMNILNTIPDLTSNDVGPKIL